MMQAIIINQMTYMTRFCKILHPIQINILAVPFLTVWMNTASPPQYRTQTCQLPITHSPTRFLCKNAGLLMSYTNCQTPSLITFAASLKHEYQLILQSRHTTRTQRSLTPPLPPLPQWHLQSLVSLFYSTAEEGHDVWPKTSHPFPNNSAGPMTRTCCLGTCRFVSPIIFIICLSRFSLLCYIVL